MTNQILSDALAQRGYAELTPVQEAVTRPELEGADLLVSAQTGSGKTVAFGLALGPTLLDGEGTLGPAGAPVALIVAPTRELALQVMRELSWLYAGAGARLASCVGGMDMREERRALERGAHIVVGTPGRLRDHIQRGSLQLGQVRAVVLDEADEMLDMGFREDLEFMLGQAPEDRRTLLFSATVPPAIAKLAAQFQRDAVRVTAGSGTAQHADIAYQAMRVAATDAETAIVNVLRFHDAANAIVFANTRAAVARISARFANRGLSVVTLSGELSQSLRTHALQAMRDGRARVCVATDVAARGIDLPNLDLVIHAELPANAEGLLHRSGRTGRAGRKGTSVLIVPPKAVRRAEGLLRAARVEADWTRPPGADEILRRDEERLLDDPIWREEVTEEQAAFAARLLALHGPEAVAAAFLRLRRAGLSAPEDLADADAPAPPKERASFGPSEWVVLSVGRDRNAEPRWLLPMILRAGGLDRTAVGAIRVHPTETFVGIARDRVAGFFEALGEKGELGEGIVARPADGPPGPAPRRAAAPRPAREPRRAETLPPDGDERMTGREPSPVTREPGPADAPVAEPPQPERDAPRPYRRPALATPVAEPEGAEPRPGPSKRRRDVAGPAQDAKSGGGRSGARQAKATARARQAKAEGKARRPGGPGPRRDGAGPGKPPRRGKP